MSKLRNALVLAVLKAADKPIGPTDISRRISAAQWGNWKGYAPEASEIMAVLYRIRAVRHDGGKYTTPPEQPAGQRVESALPAVTTTF